MKRILLSVVLAGTLLFAGCACWQRVDANAGSGHPCGFTPADKEVNLVTYSVTRDGSCVDYPVSSRNPVAEAVAAAAQNPQPAAVPHTVGGGQ